MSVKIRKASDQKIKDRQRRRRRIRGKVQGTTERPRLSVFRSNKHIYAQLIDDQKGITLASASTVEEENKTKNNIDGARKVGGLIAKRAIAKNSARVVFDRGGALYHGRVKALAESARESGLEF